MNKVQDIFAEVDHTPSEPTTNQIIIIIILAIAIVGLFLYKFVFVEKEISPVLNEPEVLDEKIIVEDEPAELLTTENNISLDQDNDGLSDEEENVLGTNLLKIDTDTDGLSDFDEVKLYQTDPLNSDTDGDSFLDGDEIVNGYNPKGEGKLLNFEKALEQVK